MCHLWNKNHSVLNNFSIRSIFIVVLIFRPFVKNLFQLKYWRFEQIEPPCLLLAFLFCICRSFISLFIWILFMTKVKLLLDTDIGSGYWWCTHSLLSALQSRMWIDGDHYCYRWVRKGAELAHQICMEWTLSANFSWCFEPLQGTQRQPIAQLATDLRTNRFGSSSSPDGAIDFLHKTIIGNPGEITLLSIGPLPILHFFSPGTLRLPDCWSNWFSCVVYFIMSCQDFRIWKANGMHRLTLQASSIVYKSMVSGAPVSWAWCYLSSWW